MENHAQKSALAAITFSSCVLDTGAGHLNNVHYVQQFFLS